MSYPVQEYTEQVWSSSFDTLEEGMVEASKIAARHDGLNGIGRAYEVIEINVVYAPGNQAGGPVLANVVARFYEGEVK